MTARPANESSAGAPWRLRLTLARGKRSEKRVAKELLVMVRTSACTSTTMLAIGSRTHTSAPSPPVTL